MPLFLSIWFWYREILATRSPQSRRHKPFVPWSLHAELVCYSSQTTFVISIRSIVTSSSGIWFPILPCLKDINFVHTFSVKILKAYKSPLFGTPCDCAYRVSTSSLRSSFESLLCPATFVESSVRSCTSPAGVFFYTSSLSRVSNSYFLKVCSLVLLSLRVFMFRTSLETLRDESTGEFFVESSGSDLAITLLEAMTLCIQRSWLFAMKSYWWESWLLLKTY